MKLSKNKNSIPGVPNIEIIWDKRYIVQEDEEVKWVRLLKPLYDNWEFIYDRPSLEDISIARERVLETRGEADFESFLSEVTQGMVDEFKERKEREEEEALNEA